MQAGIQDAAAPAAPSEREFEDHFYLHDLPPLLRSPLFRAVDARKAAYVRQHALAAGRPRVLSLGAGDGRKEALLAAHAERIDGADLSSEAVRLANERLARHGCTGVRIWCADVFDLELEPASYDVVMAIGLLHHLDDGRIDALLDRVYGWLRPGGLLVTNDPQDLRFVALFRRLFLGAYRKYHHDGERELNIAALRAQLARAGFAPPQVRFTDFFLDPLGWVFPRFPGALVGAARRADDLLLAVPGLRRLSSHFGLLARKPLQPGAGAAV